MKTFVDGHGVRHAVRGMTLRCDHSQVVALERVYDEDRPLTCLSCIHQPRDLIAVGTPVKVTQDGVAPAQSGDAVIGTVISLRDVELGLVDVRLTNLVGTVTLPVEKP